LSDDDILFQTVRPYQKNNYYFKLGKNYVASTGYAQIRAKKSSEFLYHQLHTDKFVNKVLLRCTGTSYPDINSNDLSKIKILLPTLSEQTKIANFLTAVDDKITNAEKQLVLIKDYKKGIMQRIFSQEIRFKDDDGKDFPDWEEKKLRDLTSLMQSGLSRMLSDLDIGLPVIRSNNLIDGRLNLSEIKYWYRLDPQGSKTKNYFLNDNDLLINFINSQAQIGKVAIYKNILNRDVIFTTNIMRIRFKSFVNPLFVVVQT
jgi:type I restriction enzyme S subunit